MNNSSRFSSSPFDASLARTTSSRDSSSGSTLSPSSSRRILFFVATARCGASSTRDQYRRTTDDLSYRLCGILSTWMQTSPGDFAAPTTFGLLQPFLESLLPRGATWVAHYAFELVPLLAPISSIPDPESGWAIPDKTADDSPSLSPVTPRPPLPERRPSHAASYASSSSFAPARPDAGQAASLVPSSTASGSADLVSYDGTPMSRQHTSSDVGTVETQASSAGTGASAEALTRTMPSSAMLVDLSNAILEMREQDIATQITRITWQAFSGMTVRSPLLQRAMPAHS